MNDDQQLTDDEARALALAAEVGLQERSQVPAMQWRLAKSGLAKLRRRTDNRRDSGQPA